MDRYSPASRPSWIFYPDTAPPEGSGRMVMLHGQDPRWLVVNATTREIAHILNNSGREAAADVLAERYGLSQAQARHDVDRVAEELESRGFFASGTAGPERRTPVAESLFLHITDRCNYCCVHCYQAEDREVADMPLEAFCRLIDEAAAAGTRGVTISGGEPLLHPRARDLIAHAARKMRVRLLTNGSLIDEQWARFLSETGALVQVSVDGADEATHDGIRTAGSFAAAMGAVELLQQAGMGERINLSATIMEQNLHQLSGIIRLAEQRGVPLVRFLPLARRGRAAGNWDRIGAGVSVTDHEEFYRLVTGEQRDGSCAVSVSCGLSGFLLEVPPDIAPDGIWCSVGRTLVADVDGSAYPCVLMMREEFRLGNLLDDGLQSCLEHSAMAESCGALTERRRQIPECAACNWQNLCQAGCMGQALDHRGTIWDRDDFCSYRQEAYQEAFDGILQREDGRSPALHQAHYRILDTALCLASDSEQLLELFDRDYASFRTPADGGNADLSIKARFNGPGGAGLSFRRVAGRAGAGELVGEQSLDGFPTPVHQAWQWVTQTLFDSLQDYLLLHAAVVVHNSRAVILAGPPGTGKTTLAMALAGDDFLLFSDEICPIHRKSGQVHPFPRSLWVVSEKGGKRPINPSSFADTSKWEGTARPGLLLILDPGPGAGTMGRLVVGTREKGWEPLLDDVIRLHPGMVVTRPKAGVAEFHLDYPKGNGLAAALAGLLETHRECLLNQFVSETTRPDFKRSPVLAPVPAHEAAFGLLPGLKQRIQPSGQGKESGSAGRLTELIEHFSGTACFRLTVGRLEEEVPMVRELAIEATGKGR